MSADVTENTNLFSTPFRNHELLRLPPTYLRLCKLLGALMEWDGKEHLAAPIDCGSRAGLSKPRRFDEVGADDAVLGDLESCRLSAPLRAIRPSSYKPNHNDLRSIPTLIALMAGLPIVDLDAEPKVLGKYVGALLPDIEMSLHDLSKWYERAAGNDETDQDKIERVQRYASDLIDRLYEIAAMRSHALFWNLADRVLFHLVCMCGHGHLMERLRSRFEEVRDNRPFNQDIVYKVTLIAEKRLGAILMAANAEAASVGHNASCSSTTSSWHSLSNDLIQDMRIAHINPLDAVEDYCLPHMLEVAEFNQDLANRINERDAKTQERHRKQSTLEPDYRNGFIKTQNLLQQSARLAEKVEFLLGFYIETIAKPERFAEGSDTTKAKGLLKELDFNKFFAGLRELTDKEQVQAFRHFKREYSKVLHANRKSGKTAVMARDGHRSGQPALLKAEPLSDKNFDEIDAFDENLTDIQNLQADEIEAVDGDDVGLKSWVDQPTAMVVLDHLPKRTGLDNKGSMAEIEEKLLDVPLPLQPTPDLKPVRDHLHYMLPHLACVTDRILNSMAAHRTIRLPPILLVGEPGCGKTTLLEDLTKALDIASITVDVAGTADANLLGVDARWGSAAPGVQLDLLMQSEIANPVIIFDELEKLGGSQRNGNAQHKLLGLLEPRRSASFFDPYLNTPMDLSRLNWLFTANEVTGISAPLLNRLEVIHCLNPDKEHLGTLADQLLKAEYEAQGLHPAWCQPLTLEELETLARYWPRPRYRKQGGAIRDLRRYVCAIIQTREMNSTIM